VYIPIQPGDVLVYRFQEIMWKDADVKMKKSWCTTIIESDKVFDLMSSDLVVVESTTTARFRTNDGGGYIRYVWYRRYSSADSSWCPISLRGPPFLCHPLGKS